jgi:hypothetical protein
VDEVDVEVMFVDVVGDVVIGLIAGIAIGMVNIYEEEMQGPFLLST